MYCVVILRLFNFTVVVDILPYYLLFCIFFTVDIISLAKLSDALLTIFPGFDPCEAVIYFDNLLLSRALSYISAGRLFFQLVKATHLCTNITILILGVAMVI